MNEPITVAVDLIINHPTFFSRIFEVSSVDNHAYAKTIHKEFDFEPSPYKVMAEEVEIEFNGNDSSRVFKHMLHNHLIRKLEKFILKKS